MSYVLICTLSFAVSLSGAFLISRLGKRLGLIDKPNQRSSHSIPVPRGGGIGILTAFIFAGLITGYDVLFIYLAGIVGLLGLMEDRFALSSTLRLLVQMLIAALVVLTFRGIPESIAETLFYVALIFFITGTANFYNFMDGINGIAGLTAVITYGLLAIFCFFIVKNAEIGLISLSLLFANLGFLPFNFPQAKVFMGDVGSVFLGFVFAFFVVKLSVDINIFLCLVMFLSTFYADTILTIIFRWKQGEDLMKAHRSHLYQYMSNELAIPHWKVASLYAAFQLIFGLLALLSYGKGFVWQLVVFMGFVIIFILSYKAIKNFIPAYTKVK